MADVLGQRFTEHNFEQFESHNHTMNVVGQRSLRRLTALQLQLPRSYTVPASYTYTRFAPVSQPAPKHTTAMQPRSPQQLVKSDGLPQKAIVISGFAGIGKSHISSAEVTATKGYTIVDLDSCNYSHTPDKKANPNFPGNYIKAIKALKHNDKTIVLVATHTNVRDELVKENIFFSLVYPHKDLKEEYRLRYKARNNPTSYIDLMMNNWDNFVDGCHQQKSCSRFMLMSKQFLTDVIAGIISPTGSFDLQYEDLA
jgi:hypothetical protein